jgi:hypothetical protein
MAATNYRNPEIKIKQSELDAYIEGIKQGIDITTADNFYACGYYRWFGGDRFQSMALTTYNNGKVIGNLSDRQGMYNQFMVEGEIIHVDGMTIINLLKRPTNAFYQFIKDGEYLVGQYEGRFGFDESVWTIDPTKGPETDYAAWLEICDTHLDFTQAIKENRFPGFKYVPPPDYVLKEIDSQVKEAERQFYLVAEEFDEEYGDYDDITTDHIYRKIFQNAEWVRIREEIKADHKEARSEFLRDRREITSDRIHDTFKYLEYEFKDED